MAVSRIFEAEQALDLFRLTQAQGLEGIVAKKKDSLYLQGRRTKSWPKSWASILRMQARGTWMM